MGHIKSVTKPRTTMTNSPSAADRGGIHGRFALLLTSGFERRGVPTRRLFSAAGIDPDEASDPNYRLTQKQFTKFLRALTRVSGDELWLLGDHPVPLGTFKTMCRLVMQETTLEAAIRTGCRLYHIATRDFVLRFRRDDRVAHIWITERFEDSLQRSTVNRAIIFMLYGFLCWLVGRRIPLLDVRFNFSDQRRVLDPVKIYGCALKFDAPRTALTFDASWLSLPPVPDERRLTRFLNAMPGNLAFGFRDELSFTERVQAVLLQHIETSLSLEDAARILNSSSATLRRRLQEESNVSFQRLKDRVRHRVAVELIHNRSLTLTEIAWKLGFAELSTFNRAFKRWTGSNPSDLRPSA